MNAGWKQSTSDLLECWWRESRRPVVNSLKSNHVWLLWAASQALFTTGKFGLLCYHLHNLHLSTKRFCNTLYKLLVYIMLWILYRSCYTQVGIYTDFHSCHYKQLHILPIDEIPIKFARTYMYLQVWIYNKFCQSLS